MADNRTKHFVKVDGRLYPKGREPKKGNTPVPPVSPKPEEGKPDNTQKTDNKK